MKLKRNTNNRNLFANANKSALKRKWEAHELLLNRFEMKWKWRQSVMNETKEATKNDRRREDDNNEGKRCYSLWQCHWFVFVACQQRKCINRFAGTNEWRKRKYQQHQQKRNFPEVYFRSIFVMMVWLKMMCSWHTSNVMRLTIYKLKNENSLFFYLQVLSAL